MITSTANQKVKEIIQLQKKAALRNRQDVCIAEGIKMLEEAPKELILQAYIAEGFLRKAESDRTMAGLLEKAKRYETVSDRVMEAMSDTKTPQGILCVMRQQHYCLEDMLGQGMEKTDKMQQFDETRHFGREQRSGRAPRILLLENLRDPGNLGTIMRTAEGAGMAGVILTEGCVDMYNPKTIRSTMGSLYRVPFLYMKESEQDEVFGIFRQKRLPVYGAALCRNSVNYDAVYYRNGCVIMIGNEANGLSDDILARADKAVHIPMEGKLESLNASVAAAILMYASHPHNTKGLTN